MTVLTPYTPQACLDGSVTDLFHENLQWTLAKIGASENLFVGISMVTLERMQMDMRKFMVVEGFGRRNLAGERILEFAVAHNLVVSNSLFTKREGHLVTCQSGENQSQID